MDGAVAASASAPPQRARASLRQVLITLGDPLIEPLVAPRGLGVEARDVVISDPDDDLDARPGDLVLVIGARGRAAVSAVRAAGRAGAAAVLVKVDSAEQATVLRQAAVDTGVALLGVPPEARWERLATLARGVLASAEASPGEGLGDLFSLAQTIAALTGGTVSIEDTANRVLAYSRSSDEVDELRRLSILGRQGPEPYLALLREWGVYERLRASEEVVRIAERPELGIRGRLAVGMHVGDQLLGTIWVQEGREPLSEAAERALLGAARVTALHLIRQRNEPTAGLRFRENLLAALLDGRTDAESVAEQIGADATRPAAVAVFTLRTSGRAGIGRAELELKRAEMTNLISVHAAAYRRSALVTPVGTRTYVLLPDLPELPEPPTGAPAADCPVPPAVLGMTREVVATARRHLGMTVQAAVGSPVPTLDEVPRSRQEADRVLAAMARDVAGDVATLGQVRSQVLLSETLALLAANPEVRDPRLGVLLAHDAEHDSSLAESLLAYLDAFGDVRTAAHRLHVHPNTLRYRVRRAVEVTGLDLDDPRQRLFAQLQLRLS
ncbi:PucR family transcriptional regulator [Goodfellowiella coeruleoviolacea]|uniref:DNA-binding transcriptional regulator, PucR family n=1 Tax=Goodfellowiella coeruleoviolacea TaxID=334858 RepID=A0AAE3GBY9_9PSEU|nr:helix-turn-helix domain-containing protein [Goodfellowiella coeruleoviolacea]MCP2165003.1 DNA-binding transcriptional regulator, PucR family [Goodfellowiella coeruleoviolacea]